MRIRWWRSQSIEPSIAASAGLWILFPRRRDFFRPSGEFSPEDEGLIQCRASRYQNEPDQEILRLDGALNPERTACSLAKPLLYV